MHSDLKFKVTTMSVAALGLWERCSSTMGWLSLKETLGMIGSTKTQMFPANLAVSDKSWAGKLPKYNPSHKICISFTIVKDIYEFPMCARSLKKSVEWFISRRMLHSIMGYDDVTAIHVNK